MKVKYSIIPFIPAALAMLVLRIMGAFGVDENGMVLGMNRMTLSYTVIGIGLALFVVCIIINLFDRKTAPVYPVKRNPAAGVLSVLSGVLVIAASAAQFLNNTTDSEYYIMTLVSAVFAIPAGIALMVMSRTHFTGKSAVSGISMLFVFPALWGCCELVYEFLTATKVSISATDLTSLFCYIFLTLYVFSHAMVVSRIKGRNPVKACFIYGLPAAAFALTNGVSIILTASQEGFTYTNLLLAAQFIALGLYAASFLIEMFSNSYTKDEIEIIDGLPDEIESKKEEDKYLDTKGYDELVFSERGKDSAKKSKKSKKEKAAENPTDEYYSSSAGIDDFIIGYADSEDDHEPIPYLTKNEMERAADADLVFPQNLRVVEVESGATYGRTAVPQQPAAPAPQPEPEPEPEVPAAPEPEPEFEPEVPAAPDPEPEPEEPVAPAPKAEPVADSISESVDESDGISEERLSEIDRLLRELDSKK